MGSPDSAMANRPLEANLPGSAVRSAVPVRSKVLIGCQLPFLRPDLPMRAAALSQRSHLRFAHLRPWLVTAAAAAIGRCRSHHCHGQPTKKSGARKKAEKQKKRQQEANTIRQKMRQDQAVVEDVTTLPGNMEMVCDSCELRQKNRAFCYFCGTVQRLPQCAQCGRTKCMSAGGECLVPHPGRHATGMSMVVRCQDGPAAPAAAADHARAVGPQGAVCDFCEAWVCHSRRCVQEHACACALRSSKDDGASSVVCTECERSVWEHGTQPGGVAAAARLTLLGGPGGQVFRCATCRLWLCQDDQFQHQAMCQTLDQETFKCTARSGALPALILTCASLMPLRLPAALCRRVLQQDGAVQLPAVQDLLLRHSRALLHEGAQHCGAALAARTHRHVHSHCRLARAKSHPASAAGAR